MCAPTSLVKDPVLTLSKCGLLQIGDMLTFTDCVSYTKSDLSVPTTFPEVLVGEML